MRASHRSRPFDITHITHIENMIKEYQEKKSDAELELAALQKCNIPNPADPKYDNYKWRCYNARDKIKNADFWVDRYSKDLIKVKVNTKLN